MSAGNKKKQTDGRSAFTQQFGYLANEELVPSIVAIVSGFLRVDFVGVQGRSARTDCGSDQCAFFTADQPANQRTGTGSDSDIYQVPMSPIEARFLVCTR